MPVVASVEQSSTTMISSSTGRGRGARSIVATRRTTASTDFSSL